MKTLILGGTGVAGTHMAIEFRKSHEVKTVARTGKADIKMDVSDFPKLKRLVRGYDVVINCVKQPISAEEMEKDKPSATRLNTTLPSMLAKWQRQFGYLLVHISSDWVYEGVDGETYNEQSRTRPINFYGRTKLDAEKMVRKHARKHLIIRAEGIFGLDEKRTNMYLRLKDLHGTGTSNTNNPFRATYDQYAQPICGAELARITRLLVEGSKRGTFNVTGKEYISRIEFALLLKKAFRLDTQIIHIFAIERNIRIPRFLKVDTSKAEKAIGKIKTLAEQFNDLKETEGNHGF